MNINRLAAKRALDLQRSAGIFDHPQHDQMLCNYADAAAEDVMKEIQEQLPKIVSETVDRYMNSNRNENEIAGYRDVLATIHENYDYIPPRANE